MKNKNKTTKVKKDKFRDWLDNSTKTLIDLYGVGAVTIIVHEKMTTAETDKKEGVVLFRINYSTAYKTANLWYYPYTVKLYKEKKFSMLRQALTHEIAHIITEKLASLACERYASKDEIEEATESLTETIGQLCRKLMDAKQIQMV